VEARDFRIAGIEIVRAEGKIVSLIASHNVDSIVEHIRMLQGRSIDVAPLTLKEIFLGKMKARS
jgi:hypothetical protein